jgi:hypothetical protein
MDTGRCKKTMPYEMHQRLSEHAQHVCRFISCDPGEVPPQLQQGKPKL